MKKEFKQAIPVLIGNAMIAFAIDVLILRAGIIVGGISGFGVALEHYFGLPLSIVVGGINVVLFICGLIVLGKRFALTTLLSSACFPLFLEAFSHLPTKMIPLTPPVNLLSAVIAGIMIGIGIGTIIKAGGSTGGTDIPALIMNRKLGLPVHTVVRCLDISFLAMQCGYCNLTHILLGLLTVLITSYAIKFTLGRQKTSSTGSDALMVEDGLVHNPA